MEARFGIPGYLVVVDAEGAELVDTRTVVTGMDRDRIGTIEFQMAMAMGDGCHLVFRETGGERSISGRRNND